MKPTTTVADFIKRGREARQDALGIANDIEATMAMAAVQRDAFVRERSEGAVRRWRELVADVAAAVQEDDSATKRWLGIEHARLGRACKQVAINDPTLLADAARWIASLDPAERDEVVSRFELDLMAPLTAVVVDSRG